MKTLYLSLAAFFMGACASGPHSVSGPVQTALDHDELFRRAAEHHQYLITNMARSVGTRLSYEDAAFMINRNHTKETQRVLRCAKQQEGFEGTAIYKVPPRYELHYYFLGGAKAKLSNCTRDPLFIAHDVKYSAAELHEAAKQAADLLQAKNIEFRSEVREAEHLLFETNQSSPILNEQPHVKVFVEPENLASAKSALSALMTKHPFLFVLEGRVTIDEVIVETSEP